MKITKVSIKRFKQFKDDEVEIRDGLTIVAGGNNAGKSSMLQALAVWEFCKVATLAEKGAIALTASGLGAQGLGIGDDEFSPINVPTLNHLWTNLRSSKVPGVDPDGYTLSLGCWWIDENEKCGHLEFSLSLANDRLFVKVSDSNLVDGDRVPSIAYLPPFAGISAREERTTGAMRRRRVGEGLAGAVLRNLLLDMRLANLKKRDSLAVGKSRVSEKDLTYLRETDPWELLQHTLREIFNAEIVMGEFNEEYHSYIQANVVKGRVDGYKLTRHQGYKPRDLMVEGSGFLQWLSVYTLATSPATDVLLFDEPDAHLHAALQAQMVDRLSQLAAQFGKQVLLATHSTEIIRATPASEILEVRGRSGPRFRYLGEDDQKVGLMVGIGSDYAPRIDCVRRTKRVLFYEGKSDKAILGALAEVIGIAWPTNIADWQTSDHVKERKIVWRHLRTEFGDVQAISIRDRDDETAGSVGSDLFDKNTSHEGGFMALKWRRRYIEAYLIWPDAIAAAAKIDVDQVRAVLDSEFGFGTIGAAWTKSDAADAFMDSRAKDVLAHFGVNPLAVAKQLPAEAVCEDIKTFLHSLAGLAS